MIQVLLFCFLALGLGCSNLSTKTNYKIQKDISFDPEQPQLKGDAYIPEQRAEGSLAASYPMVLVIHGGGWDSRAGDMESICKDLARRGFVAFNMTYRLAPEVHYPAPLQDARAALNYLRQNAVKLGGDAEQIFVWGYSAGAHLALMLGFENPNEVKGIVAGGSPTDFTRYPDSPIITKFIGKTYQSAPQLWQEASPVTHVTVKAPPVFMYHGKNDDLVGIDQMQLMKEKLEQNKVPVKTKTVGFWGHALTYFFSQESVDEGIQWLESVAI